MDERLIQALDNDVLVVCRGARLARQLRWQHARRRRDAGDEAWSTPRATSWDGWVKNLAEDVLWSGYTSDRGARSLLSDAQELALWEQIIGGAGTDGLLNLETTARLAREAWSMVQRWRLPDPGRSHPGTDETRAFARWMRTYYARCEDGSWLDSARLADTLTPAIRAGAISPPDQILLCGFDDLDPQQRSLLKALEESGARLSWHGGSAGDGRARKLSFDDPEMELETIARWARFHLASGPDVRIGIVVPDLDADGRRLRRVFDQILMPGSQFPGGASGERIYNVAGGVALARCPAVRGALALLGLCRPRVSMDAIGLVLRGPFSEGAPSESSLRAQFDLWLRTQGFTDLAPVQLAELAVRFGERAAGGRHLESLQTAFRLLAATGPTARQPRPPAEWARRFRALLDAFGWPGITETGVREQAVNESFRELLADFSNLDALGVNVSADGALDRLQRLAARARFRFRPAEPPVQVLDPERAAGLSFDHLWLYGIDDEHWPPGASPNPFVPVEWQRQRAIPGATAESALAAAQRTTDKLLSGGGNVLVSWVSKDQDRERAPSPLILCVPNAIASDVPLADDPRSHLAGITDVTLESLIDDQAPALSTIEVNRAGGTRVFELQAQCPFRAFAQQRLGAEPFEEPAPGLDARSRGQLLHSALEQIFNQIGSHRMLVASLGSEHLETQAWKAAETALALFERRREAGISQRLRELERRRLIQLVLEWLAVERDRAPFEVIASEAVRTIELGGIEVRMRIDRIDYVAGVGNAIIDYKTGRCNVADWFGPRPQSPQLPLYALSEEQPVAALMYGQVRAGNLAFAGVASDDRLFPGIAAYNSSQLHTATGLDWDQLLPAWREVLDGLGRAFAAGDARVDPKQPPATCRYCHLSALCRIAQAAPDDE